jgi:hypothetical protein
MCVWPAIDSAPGGHRDLSPVSLDPVWPEGVPLRKNFHKKWTVAELLKKKVLCFSMRNILVFSVFMFKMQLIRKFSFKIFEI